MEFKRTDITKNIFLLSFETQLELARSFLRFQEHYESPFFKGKIFSLEEFKEWYVKNSPKGKKTGQFTYYQDWNGFNIPSYVLQPFYQGKFDPLSNEEEDILNSFKGLEKKFYVIGNHNGNEKSLDVLRHELAHGLFYTSEDYRQEVLGLLNAVDLSDLRQNIQELGYHPDVLTDESHAYSLSGYEHFKKDLPKGFREKLVGVYNKHLLMQGGSEEYKF